jgi:hypothetical protein
MKTLTTLTAVVALIAGMSIAGAQTPTNQGKAGSMGSSPTQSSQTIGSGKFCITSTAGGALNCKYASLAACEKDAKTSSQTCSANPNQGTTGSKQ